MSDKLYELYELMSTVNELVKFTRIHLAETHPKAIYYNFEVVGKTENSSKHNIWIRFPWKKIK